MAASLDLGDLRFLLVDLSAKADAGDEDAAIRLNQLALQCTPEVALAAAGMAAASVPLERSRTLGELLGECLSEAGSWPLDDPAPWRTAQASDVTYGELFEAFADEVAPALGLPRADVMAYILNLPPDDATWFECAYASYIARWDNGGQTARACR